MTRIVTSLILIPAVAYVILLGPMPLFQAVVAAMAFVCYREYARIAGAPHWLGQAAGFVLLFSPVADWRLLWALAAIIILWMLREDDLARVLPSSAALIFGLAYVFAAWRCAFLLREHSPWWIFFAVSVNWVGDTAAMYTGKSIGRHKMAPVISPKKTWEGAVASAILATVYGVLLLPRVLPSIALPTAAIAAFAACVAGQLGDLAESAMKRGAGVKDSGTMLPGHGGWLDRLDSTLFSMPSLALYLSLLPIIS